MTLRHDIGRELDGFFRQHGLEVSNEAFCGLHDRVVKLAEWHAKVYQFRLESTATPKLPQKWGEPWEG